MRAARGIEIDRFTEKGGFWSFLSTVAAGIVCICIGYVFGRGLAGTIGVFREMAFGVSDAQLPSPAPPWSWGIFVGLFAGVVGHVWYSISARSLNGDRPPAVPGFFLIMTGTAVGSWIQSSSWVEPSTIGLGSSVRSRGFGAWAMYHADFWLPMGFAVVAVVVFAASVGRRKSSHKRRTRARSLLGTGHRVTGVITEVRQTGTTVNDVPLTAITVQFTDHAGTERIATKRRTFSSDQMPVVGGAAAIFIGPAAVNEELVLITLEPPDVVDGAVHEGFRSAAATLLLQSRLTYLSTGRAVWGRNRTSSLEMLPPTSRSVPNPRSFSYGDIADVVATMNHETPGVTAAWAEVTDVVLSPSELGTDAVLTVVVTEVDPSPFTAPIQATFVEGSPRLAQWCRIDAVVPVLVFPGEPPRVVLDPSRPEAGADPAAQ